MNEYSFILVRPMDGTTGTKRKIERAALRLFVERGVAETSIREIAAQAGVSQGAMYNHYASKDELAWELFAAGWSEMGHELRLRAHENRSLEDKFRAMIRYVFERYDQDWVYVTYVFVSRHLHLRQVTPKMESPYMMFRLVIAEAIRKGEIRRQDPELATSLVVGAIIQVTDSKILGRLKGKLSRYADATASACLATLKG